MPEHNAPNDGLRAAACSRASPSQPNTNQDLLNFELNHLNYNSGAVTFSLNQALARVEVLMNASH